MTNDIKTILEEANLPAEVIEEVLARSTPNQEEVEKYNRLARQESVESLQERLLLEDDWRVRSQIAARIMSINLENGY